MFTEDLSVFFATTDFGVTATVGAASINGIFDREYFEGGEYEGNQPVFTCQSADATAIARGTTMTLDGATYKVVGIQPDGTGLMRLILEAQ